VTTRERITDLSVWTEVATVVALSVVLGNIRLLQLPAGGSISLAALPIVMFALVRGPRRALLVGAIAGCAHLLFGGTVIHPLQAVLDYPVSYAVLALAGIGRWIPISPRVGVCVGMTAQLAAMTASGAIFFASIVDIADPWRYAFIYNAVSQVPEAFIAVLLAPSFVAALHRVDRQFTAPTIARRATTVVTSAAQPIDGASAVGVPQKERGAISYETAPHSPFQLPSLAAAMQRSVR
jgi:thiamine transporter